MKDKRRRSAVRWSMRVVRIARGSRLLLVSALLLGALAIAILENIKNTAKPLTGIPNIEYVEETTAALPSEDFQTSYRTARRVSTTQPLTPTGPTWIRFKILVSAGRATTVELRMLRSDAGIYKVYREGQGAAQTPVLLTTVSRVAKGGMAIDLPANLAGELTIYGYITPTTVVRVKGALWDADAFTQSELEFERGGGALAGTLFILALFSAVIAALNRDRTYWIFAGWLITTYRVAAVNAGWDFEWLGLGLGTASSLGLIRITLAAHAVLTVELFAALFRSELFKLGNNALLCLRMAMLGLLLAAVVLQHNAFLATFWAIGGAGMVVLLAILIYLLARQPSRIAAWYTTSWAFLLGGSLTEVAFISGIIDRPIPGVNVQTGAVASAIITAIALAERLRIERAEKQKARRRAVEAVQSVRDSYNSIPLPLFSLSHDGIVTNGNPAFQQAAIDHGLGGSPTISWNDLFGPEAFSELKSRLSRARSAHIEKTADLPDGTVKTYMVEVTSTKDCIEGSLQDISVRKAAEHRLQHLADHDPLTDLGNRRALERELDRCSSLIASGSLVCLAYIDLDRFKLVNDLFGHIAGDHVLREISARLKATLGTTHAVARVGGDEFVVVMHGCGLTDATKLCEQLLAAVGEAPIQFADKAFSVTAGAGLIQLSTELTPRDALAACDRACADAKRNGGGHVIAYSAAGDELRKHLEEIRLVAVMRDGLPTDRLFFQLQPIVSLRSPFEGINYEVLTRMRDSDGTVIAPTKFIAAAERNGAMAKIDRWVLSQVLQWLATNPQHLPNLGFTTVNLSGASLNDERFVEDSLAMIRDYGPLAFKLCFEITETVALYDLRNTSKFIDRIRALGSRVALDDFGAGYTSFNYLRELPADFVKVDGAFIRDIDRQPSNYAITRAIVDLSHHIGLQVIAEWAESRSVVETLAKLGVDYAQGYCFARPMDPDVLLAAKSLAELVTDPSTVALLEAMDHSVPSEKSLLLVPAA